MEPPFQPTLLGTMFRYKSMAAMITDETATDVFVECGAQRWWMPKPQFFERIGRCPGGQLVLFKK